MSAAGADGTDSPNPALANQTASMLPWRLGEPSVVAGNAPARPSTPRQGLLLVPSRRSSHPSTIPDVDILVALGFDRQAATLSGADADGDSEASLIAALRRPGPGTRYPQYPRSRAKLGRLASATSSVATSPGLLPYAPIPHD